jgi:hypothetical protein
MQRPKTVAPSCGRGIIKMDDTITLRSTSLNSAVAQDIVLRLNENTRLVFRPIVVNNPNFPAECVKGHFIYQRKLKSNEWEDTKSISLTNLKAGDGINIELKSKELFTLIKNLAPLYKIYKAHGILFGENEFVLTSHNLANVLKQIMSQQTNIHSLLESYGDQLIAEIFKWLAKNSGNPEIVNKILGMDVSELNEIDSLIGIARIRNALDLWAKESCNPNEEFWQQCFSDRPWILCHATSFPVIFIKGKAYVGGKTIDNQNGNVLDFLYKNKLTENSVLIEIKTPVTKLLNKKYRNNSFSISEDLTGGINQLLSYRDSLMKESSNLLQKSKKDLKVYYPKCILIIGNFSTEIDSEEKRFSFESFRGELKNVEVITYDELFARIEHFTNIIENKMD